MPPQAEEIERAIQVAVMEHEIKGLREQQKSHAEYTTKELSDIKGSIGEIMQYISKNKFAGTLGMLAFGAAIGAFFAWVFKHI